MPDITTKKEKTMQNIINSTIKLFSQKGYNATTTALIAKDAGVSEAIIFKHFKNKENLLKEIGAIAIGEIIENISIIPFAKNIEESKEYPIKEFIKSIIEERLEFLDDNFELIKLLLIEMQYSDNLRKQISDILFPKVNEVSETVKDIIITKANVSKNRANAIIRITLGFITSIIIQKYLLGIDISKTEIDEEIEETLEILSTAMN